MARFCRANRFTRLQPQRFLKFHHGVIDPPTLAKRSAKIVMYSPVAWHEIARFPQLLDRILGLAFFRQGHSEPSVGAAVLRIQESGVPKRCDGGFFITLLLKRNAALDLDFRLAGQ